MSKLSTEERQGISGRRFAFPAERKEPLEDAAHVRNAIARFNQVQGVTDGERDAAWKRVMVAASRFGVALKEDSRKELKPRRGKGYSAD